MVVVSFNYRLGVFGFFASPQLDAEYGTSGMWGILDQLAALNWVKQNIANFGGDPNRVTMFGESAGAHAVGILLASPKTRVLVEGAIMESGAFWDSEHGSINTHDQQVAIGTSLTSQFSGQDLRSIPAGTLNAAAAPPADANSDPAISAYAPSLDGDVLRVSPAEAFARGAQLNVPMLGGWNAAEYFIFTARALPYSSPDVFNATAANLFGSRCLPQFEALYPASSTLVPAFPAPLPQTQASAHQLAGDVIIAEQTWEALAIPRAPGSANRYAYHFTYTSPYSPIASHTAEFPFVFGNLVPAHFSQNSPSAADQHLSNKMQAYWTNFAKFGDPNGTLPDGTPLPNWPAFTGLGGSVLQMNSTTPAAGPNTDEGRFAFIASYRSHGRFPQAWRTLGAPGDEYPGVGCGTPTFHP